MTISLYKRDVILMIYSEIGDLWPRHCEGEKAALKAKWLRRMGMTGKSFFVYAMTTLSMWEVLPFIATLINLGSGKREYLFPFQPPAFWEVNSTTSFLLTYAFEQIATIPCHLCVYIPYELIVVTLTSNVSIIFRILQVDLRNAIQPKHRRPASGGGSRIHRDGPSRILDSNNRWMVHYEGQSRNLDDAKSNASDIDIEGSFERIKEIVKIHQRLLRVVENLNDAFGLVIFIHIACSSLLICLFGFLTVVYGGMAEIIGNLLTAFKSVTIVFLLALSGQFLCDTSSGVADAAYNSLWYESDPRIRKLILIIIIRSQSPCYLSALGYSNVTLQSFSKIMSSAYTYFSLLRQV